MSYVNRVQNQIRLLLFLFILFFQLPLHGQIDPVDLYEMSLEELMQVDVIMGTFTGIQQSLFPGSMTVITAREIALTPARNILDLLEIYVPGAVFVSHYQGHRLGIRGILSDQNYSYQLLVNGKNMNLKSYYGPLFELQEKDLSSIERVEVLSGSGSAVYGAGATAGIINIITRKGHSNQFKLSHQHNLQYRYSGSSFQLSRQNSRFSYYFYGSITRSDGLEDTHLWYIDRAHNAEDDRPYGWGYMGPDWGNYGLGSDAPSLYGDYLETPEVKLHMDLRLGEALSLWARYSTYNHTLITQESFSSEGPAFSGQLAKSFAVELTHEAELGSGLTWTGKLGYDSADIRFISLFQRDALSINHIAQWGNSFTENEINLYGLLKYQALDRYKFALGCEAVYEYYGPEWGRDDDSFILSFQAPIRFAVMDTTSKFYRFYGSPVANVVDEKIDGSTLSMFGEANLKFSDRFQVLLSVRGDKHEYSDLAISPRLSLVSQWNDRHVCGILLERSVRMPPFTDLFAQHYLKGPPAAPETRMGTELIHRWQVSRHWRLHSNLFYYTVDQISWIDSERFSDLIGTFDLVGFEAALRYKKRLTEARVSYSYIRQLKWLSEIDQSAWIEGGDGARLPLNNSGENRINNMPAHALKGHIHWYVGPELTVHLNGRAQWGYQQQEMLDMFVAVHELTGNSSALNAMKKIESDLHAHGYAKPSFTLNASLNWRMQFSEFKLLLKCYAMNLISVNHLRYIIQFWETGDLRQYPRQCGFIDEPFCLGMSLEAEF